MRVLARLSLGRFTHPTTHPPLLLYRAALPRDYVAAFPWLHQGGPAVEAEANVDCVTAVKRVEECDAECPTGQSEPSTAEGHEVRVVPHHAGRAWRAARLPAGRSLPNGSNVAFIVNLCCFCCCCRTLGVKG